MEKFYTPTEAGNLPPARRVLVLAPHPDDEIFGCGGSLALYQHQGATIHVHVLTDGGGYAPEPERAGIFAARRAETDAALALIGIPPASFGGFRDRSLGGLPALGDHVRQLIADHQPDIVLAPSPWEIHPDHLATARALLVATELLRGRTERLPGLMFYEIGSPLRADLLIDLTAVWELKERAMACFSSQLAQQDYLRHISSLNAYRTYTLPPAIRHAEAFSFISADELASDGEWSARRVQGRWVEVALAAADVYTEMLEASLTGVQAALAARDVELRNLLLTLERTRENLQQANADYQAVLNSSSWRITAPLRWLRSRIASGKQ